MLSGFMLRTECNKSLEGRDGYPGKYYEDSEPEDTCSGETLVSFGLHTEN